MWRCGSPRVAVMIRSVNQCGAENCASSVEPLMAVVEDVPPVIALVKIGRAHV